MRTWRGPVLFLAAVMLLSSAAMAAGNILRAGDPAVVYDGSTGQFTLRNIPDDDLFPNFKDLMPGDERTQNITLVTEHITQPVALYLTSTPDEGRPDPLAPLTVSVSRDGTALGEFAHSIRGSIPLGIFREDGSANLRVTLCVPLTAGSDLQDARTALRWDFTAYPTDVITIEPASIDSYVGGVSSNDSGAPTLRFHVKLPNGVIWDNDRPITMTLFQEGKDPVAMAPRKVAGSDSYYCFPTLERGLKFVEGSRSLAGDYLTLTNTSDPGSRGGAYDVGLVGDPAWYITAADGDGRTYTVQVLTGNAKVYVRYVSSDAEMIDHPSSALTKVVSGEADVNTVVVDEEGRVIYRKAVAVIPEDAVYYTNGMSSHLGSFRLDQVREEDADGLEPPLVALLFDDTVSLSDDLTDKIIEARMIEHAGHAQSCGADADYSFDGWNYNFRYLDLVNYTDGNAWVSTEAETTIYWPYPEQALSDPGGYACYDYQILHYQGMSRSFTHKAIENIEDWEHELLHNDSRGPVRIVSEKLTLTEKGLRFTLEDIPGSEDNFSPFVLMWRKKGGTGSDDAPGASDGPGGPSPVGPQTPAGPSPSGPQAPVGPSPSNPQEPAGPAPGASPQSPTLPQTGQDWRPVFLTAAAGIVLLVLGLTMGKAEKGKHETYSWRS